MSDKLVFTATAFKEYVYWQTQDRKTLKRINLLLTEILRNPSEIGIGKAERLSGNLSGY
ncbi:MAG: type II toxin-antitoxin system YoeB family toxin, partial [Candidatus Adiutrix sp.]